MNFSDRVELIRKYAKAFFEVHQDTPLVASSQSFFDLSYALKHSPAPLVVLANISDSTVFLQCAKQLLVQHACNSVLLSLLRLLHVHNRVMLFADICAYIGKIIDDANGIERARLFCTPLLQPEQEMVVAQYLAQKRSKKKIMFSVKVDDSLIAGVRVIAANWVWERTISKKLRVLDALCARHAA